MTAAAHDYEHLHHVVDQLTPTQARRLRLIIIEDEEFAQADRTVMQEENAGSHPDGDLLPDSFLTLMGSIEAPADYAERHDDYIRERDERRRGTTE